MKKTIIVIVILIVIGIGAYYAINKSYKVAPIDNSKTSIPSVPNTSTNTSLGVPIDIKNLSFTPPILNIKTGTKVTWINNDKVTYTVTPDSGNSFSSTTLSPGQSFSVTFTDVGSVSYHCSIHPTMKGKIIVGK